MQTLQGQIGVIWHFYCSTRLMWRAITLGSTFSFWGRVHKTFTQTNSHQFQFFFAYLVVCTFFCTWFISYLNWLEQLTCIQCSIEYIFADLPCVKTSFQLQIKIHGNGVIATSALQVISGYSWIAEHHMQVTAQALRPFIIQSFSYIHKDKHQCETEDLNFVLKRPRSEHLTPWKHVQYLLFEDYDETTIMHNLPENNYTSLKHLCSHTWP